MTKTEYTANTERGMGKHVAFAAIKSAKERRIVKLSKIQLIIIKKPLV